MLDDDAARRALRTLTDEPAPPVATTLDQVLRRGRRRVFVQRAGAVAGVVAVVAGIGAGTILMRQDAPGDGLQVATSSTTPPPSSGDPAPPGWTEIALPPDSDTGGSTCVQPQVDLPPDAEVSLLPERTVRDAFLAVAQENLGDVPLAASSQWGAPEKHGGAQRGYAYIEVPMDDGNGQLQLEVTTYGGSPTRMADASVTAYGDCAGPHRHVLADGTVLQLYPVRGAGTEQPVQRVRIYQPDGRMYVVTAASWSEADVVPASGIDGGGTIVGGRGALPTTAAQLARISEALIEELR